MSKISNDSKAKIVSKLSDIAKYLKEAGFTDASDKIHTVMDALDGNFDEVRDPFGSSNDVQMGRSKPMGYNSIGPGLFSMDQPMVVAKQLIGLANGLDASGLYDEADKVDSVVADLSEMMNVIRKLDKNKKKKNKEKTDKQKEEVAARSNGLVGNDVTDNQNCGMFQGFSDAYFYSGYGNLGN